MSIPFHLDSTKVPYNFLDSAPIVDVADIITQFRTQVVTGLNWTEPSAALFKTPVDAAGRFMDVLLTRISAGVLEARLRDQVGFTLYTRRIQIDTGGTMIRYFANIYGFVIESWTTAQETLQGHVLDLTPDAQSDHQLYVVGNGTRNTSSNVDGIGANFAQLYAKDNGGAGVHARNKRVDVDLPNSTNIVLVDILGGLVCRDMMMEINFAGALKWAGRICHAILIDSAFAPGTLITPNIDDNTQAGYRVLANASLNNSRMAMRCS